MFKDKKYKYSLILIISLAFINCGPNLTKDLLKYTEQTSEVDKIRLDIIDYQAKMKTFSNLEQTLLYSKEISSKCDRAVLILKRIDVKNPDLIILHDTNQKYFEAMQETFIFLISGIETNDVKKIEEAGNKLSESRTYYDDYIESLAKINKKISKD